MEIKELFMRTVADLEQKLAAGDRYSLLRASALMRQLLFDDSPLLHAANKELKLKLVFTFVPWNPHIEEHLGPLDWHWANVGVNPAFPKLTETVRLDHFTSAQCLARLGRPFAVRHVIQFCANVAGGVHVGKADMDQSDLESLDQLARFGGIEPSLCSIRGIGQVLLEGVGPLVEALKAS